MSRSCMLLVLVMALVGCATSSVSDRVEAARVELDITGGQRLVLAIAADACTIDYRLQAGSDRVAIDEDEARVLLDYVLMRLDGTRWLDGGADESVPGARICTVRIDLSGESIQRAHAASRDVLADEELATAFYEAWQLLYDAAKLLITR